MAVTWWMPSSCTASPYGIASSSQAGLRVLSASGSWMVGHEPGDRAPPRPVAPAALRADAPGGGPVAPGGAGMHPGAVRVPRSVPAGPERLREHLLRGRGAQHAAQLAQLLLRLVRRGRFGVGGTAAAVSLVPGRQRQRVSGLRVE